MAYDRDLALYRAGLRRYDPVLGRFLTPDPLVGNLTDPQALNSYAFARNAPTAFADPTGAAPYEWSLEQLEADARAMDGPLRSRGPRAREPG
jgi:RHS repeat-associated protein